MSNTNKLTGAPMFLTLATQQINYKKN